MIPHLNQLHPRTNQILLQRNLKPLKQKGGSPSFHLRNVAIFLKETVNCIIKESNVQSLAFRMK